MRANKYLSLLVLLFISLSYSASAQTISLDDFKSNTKASDSERLIKKEKEKKILALEKAERKKIKLEKWTSIRDAQKGLSFQLFYSTSGANGYARNEDNFYLYLYEQRKGFTGIDIRLSYFKESFMPFGLYAGYGSANLFFGDAKNVDLSAGGNILEASPQSADYMIFGISKNLSLNHTIYTGILLFNVEERTEFLDNTEKAESYGFNLGFSYKLKNFVVSVDQIFHLAYYKKQTRNFPAEINLYGNVLASEEKLLGSRFQIGIGYIF